MCGYCIFGGSSDNPFTIIGEVAFLRTFIQPYIPSTSVFVLYKCYVRPKMFFMMSWNSQWCWGSNPMSGFIIISSPLIGYFLRQCLFISFLWQLGETIQGEEWINYIVGFCEKIFRCCECQDNCPRKLFQSIINLPLFSMIFFLSSICIMQYL